MARLAALVVTHNRLDQLRITLARLMAEPADRLDTIVVVDNASTDGTPDWLATLEDPRLDVLGLERNGGGAGGFAAGLARIRDRHDPDWTLLMDDDARPEPACIDGFLSRDRSAADAWFGAVYLPDSSIADMNRPWRNPFWHPGILARSLLTGRDGFHLSGRHYRGAGPTPVDGGSFVGLFLSREARNRAGLPDADLFLYGEDVLYTLALRMAGGTALFDPALRFEHDCGTLTGPGPVFRPLWKAYYFHRNQLFVYARAAGPVLFWPVLAAKWLRWRLRARAYGADGRAYRRVLAAAIRDGIARNTGRSHDEVQALATGSGSRGDSDASG